MGSDVTSHTGRRAALISLFFSLVVLTPFLGHARSVTLAWDPSPDPNVTGYNVYYGRASRSYTNTLAVSGGTSATIAGLVDGVTYYFAATCVDAVGLESDFSTEVAYTVPLPNQPPTLNAPPNVAINEGAGQQVVSLSGISSGAANETQTLTVTASSSDTSLIPTPSVTYTSPNATGSISFTPVAYAYGSATITVTVNDGSATNNTVSRSFTVTVNAVNQPPTLNALANVTVNENAGLQTVSLSGIGSGAANENQTLTMTASSSNPALIPTPTVSYSSPSATGSVSFTPLPYANGSATLTVTVNDGGASNNVVSRSFTVTVNAVNQPPTLNALGNMVVNENSGRQTVSLSGISSGMSNEVQTLTVTAASGNTGLIPAPTVTYTSPNTTGSIAFTPASNAHGTATLTVTVNDGGASDSVVSRAFTVTVNQLPVISTITNLVIATDSQTGALAFTVSDGETAAADLVVSGASSNQALVKNTDIVFGGSGAARTVTITPQAGKTGTTDITITVTDGIGSSTTTFQLGVQNRPSAPNNFRITFGG